MLESAEILERRKYICEVIKCIIKVKRRFLFREYMLIHMVI